jgi:flagellar hook assembly protein FlgD
MGALDPAGKQRPDRLELYQNYPNPFNPSTSIEYLVHHAGPIKIVIFDVFGHHIKTLVDGNRVEGNHTATWDGRDEIGKPVSSGLYLFTLKSGADVFTRKSILLR